MGVKARLRSAGVDAPFSAATLTRIIAQVGDRAVKGGSEVITQEAEIITELARSYAPVDKGNLEAAIRMEVDYEGINRRLRARIFVDMNMPAGVSEDGLPKSVGDYATRMHEGLAPYGSGAYNLGPRSRAKREAGNKVGGKFMERAFRDRADRIYERIARRIKDVA